MRIDLNRTSANEIAADKQAKRVAQAQRTTASLGTAEDTATLSADSVNVSELTAQAMQTPEIRQDKVDALRQQIQNGTYKVDPNAIAEAMIKSDLK